MSGEDMFGFNNSAKATVGTTLLLLLDGITFQIFTPWGLGAWPCVAYTVLSTVYTIEIYDMSRSAVFVP